MKYYLLSSLYILAFVTASLAFLARFFATKYWLADLLISFLPQLIFILFCLTLLFVLTQSLIGTLFAGLSIIALMFSFANEVKTESFEGEPKDQLSLLQYNLYANENTVDAFIEYVLDEQESELIFLQEVSPEFAKKLLILQSIYPYHTSYQDMLKSGLAVFSKIPIASHKILRTHDKGHYFIRVTGKTQKTKRHFVIYNIHLFSPKSKQRWQVRNDALLSLAEKTEKEASVNRMVIGDFNTPASSPWLSQMVQLSNGELAPSPELFFYSWSLFPKKMWTHGVLIDHLLLSGELFCEKREVKGDYGSDHLPIMNWVYFR